MNVRGLPGSDIASQRWPVTSPATLLVYSATTLPKLFRWMATFCPASTLSLSLTRCSTSPPCVARGAVAELVGIDGGVVSGVINLESSGVGASDRRPRHDKHYHEA